MRLPLPVLLFACRISVLYSSVLFTKINYAVFLIGFGHQQEAV